ncbi:hypothetical protein ASD14_11580 [Lysobacter sp. Root494]|nr:hypothetical protein ASD14_11580 [Lysobacter sp. Root494]
MMTAVMSAACMASPPSLVMHRQLAGEAGADGWYMARSTKGGFAVRLPAQFNDFSIPASRQDNGHMAELDVVGTKIQDIGKFSATCIRYLDKEPGKDAILAPFRGMGGTPFKDAHGEGVRVHSPEGATKVYALPGRTCLLVVEAYDDEVVTPDVIEQFFGSFTLDD